MRNSGKLIVLQTAMCVLLLAMASVFLRSIAGLTSVDPGFTAAGIIDVDVDLSLLGASAEKQASLDAILARAAALPGVQSVAMAAVVPLTGSNMETQIAPDIGVAAARELPLTYFNIVSPGYFDAPNTDGSRARDPPVGQAKHAARGGGQRDRRASLVAERRCPRTSLPLGQRDG